MTKVLAYTSPMRGHLFPVVPILEELQRRGHQVVVHTLGAFVPNLRALGIDAHALSGEVEDIHLNDWQARIPGGGQRRAMQAFGRRARVEAGNLREMIADEQPDVLLVDIMAFGALATAEASGVPWAAWLPYPAWLRSRGVPPYGPGLRPRPGPTGRVRDAALRALGALGPGRRVTAAVNRGRRAAGIETIRSADAVLLRPPLLLSMTAEPFEYSRTWPASFRLVGPCVWEPPTASPEWLSSDGRPVVLVSTSSDFQDDGRLVETAFDALRDRDDLLVVATVPSTQISLPSCPPNARVERFLSHQAVLERAIAVVCHAGMGTTQKALAAGVPVCAVPFGRDQFEVARRLEVSRSGVRLPARRLNSQRLRRAIEHAIDCEPGARRVANAFAAAGGVHSAATAIETLAAR